MIAKIWAILGSANNKAMLLNNLNFHGVFNEVPDADEYEQGNWIIWDTHANQVILVLIKFPLTP